jgi:hypothetical protein
MEKKDKSCNFACIGGNLSGDELNRKNVSLMPFRPIKGFVAVMILKQGSSSNC